MRLLLSCLAAVWVTLGLVGCGTAGSVVGLGSHPQRAEAYRTAVATGNPDQLGRAADGIGGLAAGADRTLYLMERGRLNSLAGRMEQGMQDFQTVSDLFEAERMRPAVSVSSGFFSAAALATNDLAIPYRAPGYERVMVHNLQALNYLWKGELTLARVELNRADVEQQFALQENEKVVREARQRSSQGGFQQGAANGLSQAQVSLGYAEGTIKNSFQNAFTFYLSGVLFEMLGDRNRALIDYKRGLEIYPRNRVLARNALRMALESGDRTEYERLRAAFGDADADPERGPDAARVVVIFEDGLVQPRESIRIPFFWDDALQQVVLPFYASRFAMPAPLTITAESGTPVETALACDLNVMAAKALSEMMPAIFVRQVLRVLAKHEMARAARREGGDLALFGASLFNILTDKADERSWLTLPGDIQVADFTLEPGTHRLGLDYYGSRADPVEIKVTSRQTVFMLVRNAGNRLETAWTVVNAP